MYSHTHDHWVCNLPVRPNHALLIKRRFPKDLVDLIEINSSPIDKSTESHLPSEKIPKSGSLTLMPLSVST